MMCSNDKSRVEHNRGLKRFFIELFWYWFKSVSYTHLRAHETGRNLVCRLLLEKMLDQYYKLIEKALDIACPKQKEIIINRNNPWHKGTLKQLRLEKFARYEEYAVVFNSALVVTAHHALFSFPMLAFSLLV